MKSMKTDTVEKNARNIDKIETIDTFLCPAQNGDEKLIQEKFNNS